MKRFLLPGAVLLTFAACASAPSTPATTQPRTGAPPAPPPPVEQASVPTRPPTQPPAPAFREAPSNWQLLDDQNDRVPGVSAERAYRELLAGRQPGRTITVAVIDGGIDTAHVDLRGNLWSNPRETAGNGKDDDGNGYVDDVYGWNFLGGRDGRDVGHDTFEVTRLYAACQKSPPTAPAERTRCAKVKAEFESKREEAQQTLAQVQRIGQILDAALPMLRDAARTDSLTVENVTAIRSTDQNVMQARRIYLDLAGNGITPKDVEEAKKEFESRLEYGLNPQFDPRNIVGDDYANVNQRGYGNFDVMGPDAGHGTHVAGIIGALRGNGVGVDGIASNVRLMMVRAVPDGDEHDKDIANAIRYAVDNGAQIINMSFGKAYSPQKAVVDEAVKYADSKGVLMIHAAGNDAEDLASAENYPTPVYLSGGRAANWIEVGASSWKNADSLAAPFSNYGRQQVDLFAPGVDVLSTVPGGGYEREDGTSMAAPVVTGVAALLMSYFPRLTAADVKRILLESATRRGEQSVIRPGSQNGEHVLFSTLSATGGIVNAFAAIRMALDMADRMQH